jgi:hypothetical protein
MRQRCWVVWRHGKAPVIQPKERALSSERQAGTVSRWVRHAESVKYNSRGQHPPDKTNESIPTLKGCIAGNVMRRFQGRGSSGVAIRGRRASRLPPATVFDASSVRTTAT